MTCYIRNHKKLQLILLFFLLTVCFDFATVARVSDMFSPPWNYTWQDKLKQNLLAKYDKFARPTQHYNKTTVNVSLNILTVNVNDKTNVVAVNVWNRMEWNDDKLKWNPSDYGGLTQLNVGSHEVWLPDIYLLNSAVHGVEQYGDRHCILKNSGTVLWIVPTIFQSNCNLDFTFWPFEMNTCKLSLSSWTYDGNQVDMKFPDEGYYLDDFSVTSEWMLKNVSASRRVDIYKCCPEPYIMLEYEFKLSRSSNLYYHLIFAPIIPIVFLILITFWLRPQSETKLNMIACTILIIVLYLMYLGTKVPPRYDSIPLIVRFYSGCLYQATVSLVISILVMNINKLAYYITVPRIVRRFLMGKAGRCLGLGQIIYEIELQNSGLHEEEHLVDISLSTGLNNGHSVSTVHLNGQKINELEWTLVASVIDRLFFIILTLIFVIMALICVHSKRINFSSDNVLMKME